MTLPCIRLDSTIARPKLPAARGARRDGPPARAEVIGAADPYLLYVPEQPEESAPEEVLNAMCTRIFFGACLCKLTPINAIMLLTALNRYTVYGMSVI
jgi:hypothetical protein